MPAASGSNPSVTEMSALFDRVAEGPTRYGSLGWDFAGRTTMHSGAGWCTGTGRRDTVAVSFPCVLLKSIYATESSWRQFCTTNQTVIAFDCGYGIAQVTSGMRRGDTSAFDPDLVASSPAYNVSVGAAILVDKWRATPCVGDNDPQVVEDWYFAVWGYNGLVFRNNPNNPMFAADRREFRTPGVASAQTRGNYPYPELVWGYAHYPPSAEHYRGVALAYPARSEICASCGSPTASISEPVGAHRGGCDAVAPVDAGPSVDVPRDVAVDRATPDAPDVVAALDAVDAARAPDVVDVFDVAVDRGRADAGLLVGDDGVSVERQPAQGCGCAAPPRRDARGLAALWCVALTASSWRRARRPGARSGGCTRTA